MNLACLVLFAVGAATTLAAVDAEGRPRMDGLWNWGLAFAAMAAAPPLVAGLAAAFRLRNRLRPWSMIEVFLVGCFVAYAKLGALVHMEPGPGFFALFGFMVATIAADAVLDPQAVWEAVAWRAPSAAGRVAKPASSAVPGLVCCPACELACEAPTRRRPRSMP